MAPLVAFRASDWDTPFRANTVRRPYRFNRAGSPATQYFALHPMGPLAESLRSRNIRSAPFAAELRTRVWTARFEDGGLMRLTFDNATDHGLTPEELVDDDWTACQAGPAIYEAKFEVQSCHPPPFRAPRTSFSSNHSSACRTSPIRSTHRSRLPPIP